MARSTCLGCRRSVDLGPKVKKGGWLACPHCGAGLQVVSLQPPMLVWASDRPRTRRTPNWSRCPKS
jgi:hypothetical protein